MCCYTFVQFVGQGLALFACLVKEITIINEGGPYFCARQYGAILSHTVICSKVNSYG